jgi:hypothetical protein
MDLDTFSAMVVTFQMRSSLRGLTSTFRNERLCWPFSHFVWILRHESETSLIPLTEESCEAADSVRNVLESRR